MQGQERNNLYRTKSSQGSAVTFIILQGSQVSWVLDTVFGKASSFLQGTYLITSI